MSDDEQDRLDLARAPDVYEASHMEGEGAIVYRDKFVAPWPFHLIMALSTLSIIAPVPFVPELFQDPWLLGTMGGLTLFMVAIWIMFSVLRVTVSEAKLQVQMGLFGPNIDTASIEKVEPLEDYDWKKYGGWGIRRATDGEWAYNMMGDQGRAVRITYQDGSSSRRVLIATAEPYALADSIQRARRDRGSLTPQELAQLEAVDRSVDAMGGSVDAMAEEANDEVVLDGFEATGEEQEQIEQEQQVEQVQKS